MHENHKIILGQKVGPYLSPNPASFTRILTWD